MFSRHRPVPCKHARPLLAGVSAWVAGSLGMAAAEYVSVWSQLDCEQADIQKEKDMQVCVAFIAAHSVFWSHCVLTTKFGTASVMYATEHMLR